MQLIVFLKSHPIISFEYNQTSVEKLSAPPIKKSIASRALAWMTAQQQQQKEIKLSKSTFPGIEYLFRIAPLVTH